MSLNLSCILSALISLWLMKYGHGFITLPVFLEEELPGTCKDNWEKCAAWARAGECQSNPAWMMTMCKRSCQSCQEGRQALKLRHEFARNYDNSTEGMRKYFSSNVSIHSFYASHFDINEKDQSIKLRGKMVLTWNDTRLQWDPKQWKLSWLTFTDWGQVWTPQILQTNLPVPGPLKSVSTDLLAANYTGQVYMWLNFVFTVTLDFNYKHFPFDSQKICFNLDNKMSYAIKFIISDQAQKEATSSTENAHPAGWVVKEVKIDHRKNSIKIVEDWNKDPYIIDRSSIDICVIFKRDSSYAHLEVVGPLVVPAIITLASFMIGDFKRQLYLLVGSLGLQTIALSPIHSILPPASGETPTSLKFSTFNMTMTCIILVFIIAFYGISTFQSVIPPPHFINSFINFTEPYFSCCWLNNTRDTKMGNPAKRKVENGNPDSMDVIIDQQKHITSTSSGRYPWEVLARSLKCTLFVVSLAFYLIALLICFVF